MKRYRSLLIIVTLLLALTLILSACQQGTAPAQEAPKATEPPKEEAPAATEAPPAAKKVTLEVWAEANNVEHWRADGPAKAAEMVTDFDIEVIPVNDDAGGQITKRSSPWPRMRAKPLKLSSPGMKTFLFGPMLDISFPSMNARPNIPNIMMSLTAYGTPPSGRAKSGVYRRIPRPGPCSSTKRN